MSSSSSAYVRIPESLFSGFVKKLVDIRNVAITADTNILPTSQAGTYIPLSFFLVYVVMEGTGSLAIRRTFTDLGVTKTEVLNEGFPFADNAAYIFSFPVSEDEEINFWFSQSTTCTKLTLMESQAM